MADQTSSYIDGLTLTCYTFQQASRKLAHMGYETV